MSRDKKSAIAVENLIPYSVMMRDETIRRLHLCLHDYSACNTIKSEVQLGTADASGDAC
jgi:hypothetical protein